MTSVLLLGATGLVGSSCLRQMESDPGISRVVVLARRASAAPRAAKVEWRVEALDAAIEAEGDPFAVDALICALGTTISAAGSQAAFRTVDYEYPVAAAQAAHRAGVPHYLLVSALGADPGSRVFYNRVKGETERAVLATGIPHVTIVRPSLLLGDRAELRIGEQVGKWLSVLAPRKWRGVHADDVAALLVAEAKRGGSGHRVVESGEIPRGAR